MRDRPRCQALTRAGAPCRAYAREDGFCTIHSPARALCREANVSGLPCRNGANATGYCDAHWPRHAPVVDGADQDDRVCDWCQHYQAIPGQYACIRCTRLWEATALHVTP